MGRPVYTDEQVEQGRRELCAAALSLYRSAGYEAVTLRGLAAEVGISSATPYRFFASKEALFERVRATVYTEFGEFLRAGEPGTGDPIQRLRCVARGMIEFGLKRPADYRLIFSMNQGRIEKGSALYEARRRTLDHVISICQDAVETGRLPGDARIHVHVAWVAVHGLVSFHVSDQLTHGCGVRDLIDPLIDRLFAPAAPALRAARSKKRKARRTAKSQEKPSHG